MELELRALVADLDLELFAIDCARYVNSDQDTILDTTLEVVEAMLASAEQYNNSFQHSSAFVAYLRKAVTRLICKRKQRENQALDRESLGWNG